VPIGADSGGTGCYRYQTEAIRQVIPEYEETWPMKIVVPSILDRERLNSPQSWCGERTAATSASACLSMHTYRQSR
jgi:hypothetical protein